VRYANGRTEVRDDKVMAAFVRLPAEPAAVLESHSAGGKGMPAAQ
jgi:hypothetical protein